MEPETFSNVAAVRADFATQPLDAMLGALATNSTALGGISAPPGTRQLGAWVRLHGIAGELRVALSLTDATGRSYELLLGHLRPGALVHWGFLAADLATPIGLDGAPIGGPPIETPLTIHAYYAHLSPEVAANDGGISFGPLMSSLDAPEAPLDGIERLVPRSSEFARRAILHDLSTTAGLEPIADLAAGGTSQTVRAEPPTAPGSTGSTRLDWPATPPGAPAVRVRGLRQETDGAPVLLYASRRTLDDLGAAVGDELRLEVAGRFLNAQAAGVVDHFPTLGLDGGAFAVANLERLLAAVNASPGATLRSGEAWFRHLDAGGDRVGAHRRRLRRCHARRPRDGACRARRRPHAGARVARRTHAGLRRAPRAGRRRRSSSKASRPCEGRSARRPWRRRWAAAAERSSRPSCSPCSCGSSPRPRLASAWGWWSAGGCSTSSARTRRAP